MEGTMENYFVYKHTCPNGKIYIGITSQKPTKRWKNGFGYRKDSHIYNAIIKYGWDNIKHEILFSNLTKDQAENKEIELIKLYRSTDRRYGYNIENGGNSVGKHSEESKRKASLHNPKYMLGKHHSKEVREKISKANKGENNAFYGKKHEIEIIKQLSIPVMCIETEKIYYGAKEAARELNLKTYTHICSCCKGKRETAGGYHWRYVSEIGDTIDKNLRDKILEKKPKIVKEETKIRKSKPVICIETGITYFGTREAERQTGIH